MGQVSDLISAASQNTKTQLEADVAFYQLLTLVVLVVAAITILLVGMRIIGSVLRQLGGEPEYATEVVRQVASSDLAVQIRLDAGASGSLLHAIEDMRQKLEQNFADMKRSSEETRQLAEQAQRVRQALDVCDTAALIVDAHGEIIYRNDAAQRLFTTVEPAFGKVGIPLSASALTGWSMQPVMALLKRQLNDIRALHKQRVVVADRTLDIVITPVVTDAGAITAHVFEWKDMTEELARLERERQVAQENARVRQALDNVTSNTMIADTDGNIVYLNSAVQNMLATAEKDIRTAMPSFDTKRLLGANFDSFHKNPSHQRNLLERLTGTYKTQISLGGRTFTLVANPIFNEQQQRIGSVVVWNDRTQEVAIENELGALLAAANDGDLAKRISLQGKEGFYRTISEGLNQLLTVADDVITNVSRVMDALAHGRLTETIDREYRGVFDKLKRDTNATVEILVNVVEKITESAQAVASGAKEIAQGNQDLSQRTEEQASSLEETASSMEEMNSAVKQSSDNAHHANTLATETFERAGKGGAVVSRAVSAMGAISTASKKIADIIAVIDEIAFQTNLLALNAAVEAARAGEQGRGFAVVAGEVRNLAQRSATAAKEIKELIRDSVDKVEDGTRLVNESGATLHELVESVRSVSTIISDIAAAAREQASGIAQVNVAVAQMDEMTQQNAALVEQASAAGETLSEQAAHLIELISFFDIGRRAEIRTVQTAAPRAKVARAAKAAPADDEWQEF
jgi:methyl-accepting chemotaxis protein